MNTPIEDRIVVHSPTFIAGRCMLCRLSPLVAAVFSDDDAAALDGAVSIATVSVPDADASAAGALSRATSSGDAVAGCGLARASVINHQTATPRTTMHAVR